MEKNLLFAADVSALEGDYLFKAAYAKAFGERKRKTDRYRFRKDKCASLGAELLLRHALARCGIHELAFSYGTEGKPYLTGRDDVFFSISHSGSFLLCAVSDHEIGADIECVKSANLKVAERFFCTEEYERIAAQESEEARRDMFYRYWTLKESFLKATGLGLRLPLNQFEVIVNDEITVVQSVDDRRYFFREYGDFSGCRCAVCTADAPFAAELQTVDIGDCL